MCQYILYYECVLFAVTSVINDHMCAVFQITDSILSHCGNVSQAFNLRVVTLPYTAIHYRTRQFKMTVFQES